jgi:hypothetical protein
MTVLVSGVSHPVLQECESDGVTFKWAGTPPICQCSAPLTRDCDEDSRLLSTRAVWAGEFNAECCACGTEYPIE